MCAFLALKSIFKISKHVHTRLSLIWRLFMTGHNIVRIFDIVICLLQSNKGTLRQVFCTRQIEHVWIYLAMCCPRPHRVGVFIILPGQCIARILFLDLGESRMTFPEKFKHSPQFSCYKNKLSVCPPVALSKAYMTKIRTACVLSSRKKVCKIKVT